MKARSGAKSVLRGGDGREMWRKKGMEPFSGREGEGVPTCHCRGGAWQCWLGWGSTGLSQGGCFPREGKDAVCARQRLWPVNMESKLEVRI